MVLHRHILNQTLRVSGNEKKTNMRKYLKKRNIYIYIYYILVEYYVLNIYTKWMVLTKQKVYWLIIKKQTEKNISLKKGFIKSFMG